MTGECSVDTLTTLFIKKDRQEKQIYDEWKKKEKRKLWLILLEVGEKKLRKSIKLNSEISVKIQQRIIYIVPIFSIVS